MLRIPLPALLLCALLPGACLSVRADDNHEVARIKARVDTITSTAISDDGKLLFTGEDYGQVTLWSIASGTSIQTFMGHTREVFAAALLPDGKRGVTCGDDGLVIIWDLATGKRIHEMRTGGPNPWVMSCSPDGALAATGCDDGQIMIWKLADGSLVTTLRRHFPVCSVSFSPDSKTLAAGYSDGQVVLWNASDWSQKHVFSSTDGASVGALAFSPDGRLLATGDQNGAGFVWNVSDGTQYSHFAGYANPEEAPSPPVAPVFPGSTITPDNRSSIVYVCFSPDGSSILASIQDEVPRFWEAKTGRLLGTADWFEDSRFYIARYGFTFATAAMTPSRKFVVLLKKDGDQDDYLAQIWRTTFVPNPIPQ